jgi:hypothetical protein
LHIKKSNTKKGTREMNKKHKHAELIKAWADGAEIQYRYMHKAVWRDGDREELSWYEDDWEYRIKPESKPDNETSVFVRLDSFIGPVFDTSRKNLKLIFDGETGELKSAEVVK